MIQTVRTRGATTGIRDQELRERLPVTKSDAGITRSDEQ